MLGASGELEPLGGYAGPDILDSLKDGSYEGLMMQGDLIAFPWNQAPAGFWFNKDVLEGAGLDP